MAEGRIYISGAFKKVNRSKCGGGVGWLDNDPHFWTQPPTWGICRTDYRRVIKNGDYIFYVLSKASELPQMIYGYFQVKDKITHIQAFNRHELASKRMGNKNPNGNIIVDANGQYNRFDGGSHEKRFEKIKLYYVIGDESNSEFLTEKKIRQLAPSFLFTLNKIFESNENSVFKVIGRSGRRMSEKHVNQLLAWLYS
jgi:hypothetical protein